MSLFNSLRDMFHSNEVRSNDEDPAEQTTIKQSGKQSKVAKLTPREHDLFLLLLEGYTLKESAQQLSIKYSTANTHMTGIYKKLGVNTRAELIINYRMMGDPKGDGNI
jgi:DNA-binding CsgD family transcriptional regulator